MISQFEHKEKQRQKTIFIIILIQFLIITTGIIIISAILIKQNEKITLEQAITEINKKEHTNYTYKNLNFWGGNNSATTRQINNKLWLIVFGISTETKIYLDNNHKITEI